MKFDPDSWPLVSGNGSSHDVLPEFRIEEMRVVLLAPTRNDASLTARFLTSSNIEAAVCGGMEEVCSAISCGCGAVLLAEEAFNARNINLLIRQIEDQPSWSDLPLIMVAASKAAAGLGKRLEGLDQVGNLMLLERPFRPATLIAALRVALRSRRRQYQVRNMMEERERVALAAHHKSSIFDTTLASITDFVHILDRSGRFLYANKPLLNLLGVDPEEVAGKTFPELPYPSELGNLLQEQVLLVAKTGNVSKVEAPYINPEGVSGFYEYIFSPVYGPDGEVEVVAGSTRDTSERRHAEEALRTVDQRKDEFLAMLAHELRNPLSAVSGAAALLNDTLTDEAGIWATGIIQRQTTQLAHLINDLLDVSRINTGKISLQRKVVDLAELLDRACESSMAIIRDRKHELTKNYPVGKLWLNADPIRIEQIVTNLLTNAAKYTPEGGSIQLRGFQEVENVVLQVSDNGLGLRPDQVNQMFDLFVQGERSLARSEGGLGIGLTIVRRLAELHGGCAAASSEGPDKGSTFSVRLPLAAPVAASGGPAHRMATAKQTIMVVDDNIDSAQTLGQLLRRSGHTVRVAHTGKDALEGIAAEPPEFIVLDIGLPDLDGFAVATEIRRQNLEPRPRIIGLSGYGQASDLQKAQEAGFDHYLMKPLEFAKLKQLLC